MAINLHGCHFRARTNTPNGEVGEGTTFHYRQEGDIIWATYQGGSIVFGTLSGYVVEGDRLEFSYQHHNAEGEFMTGRCSTIVKVENEKYILHENWQWTCRDHSKGSSILEQFSE